MKYRDSMDLGPGGYTFSYRNETKDIHWRLVHAHQGIEMLYVHQGHGEIALERVRHPLRGGTLVLFQPYQLHRVEVPVHADTSYIRTNLTFNPHLVEPWLEPFPGLRFFFRTLWRGVLPQQVFHLQNDERLANLLDEFQWLHPQPSDTREEDLGLFFLTLLRYLDLHVFGPGRTNAVPSRSTLHVEKIMDWAEEHFREPFHLQRLADELHLSPYHLSHLFKQCTGRTVSDYIAARRIREACSLLMLTAMPVKAIGQEVGGFSTAYFCQLFKKWKGITPQAYRETVRTLY